jgi:hypothetical protein
VAPLLPPLIQPCAVLVGQRRAPPSSLQKRIQGASRQKRAKPDPAARQKTKLEAALVKCEVRRNLEPGERARQFLQEELRGGPLLATRVEERAHRLRINGPDLEASREALGVIASPGNSGKGTDAHALTYCLPTT